MDLVPDAIAAIEAAVGDLHPSVVRIAETPELLVILDAAPVEALRRLAETSAPVMAEGVRLRVLTREELEQAADVFTLELAEYLDRGALVHGEDPFAGVRLDPAALRRSLEQGTRGLVRRLRNRVLAGVASQGRREPPDRAVAEAVERTCVLARHGLRLLGEPGPSEETDADVLARLGEQLDCDASVLVELLEHVRAGEHPNDPFAAIEVLLAVLDPLARALDRHPEPG